MEATITAKERVELADLAGVNEQYLYQCLKGLRDMEPLTAANAETATKGRLKRWMLHSKWHLVWPELKDVDGAPDPIEQKAA